VKFSQLLSADKNFIEQNNHSNELFSSALVLVQAKELVSPSFMLCSFVNFDSTNSPVKTDTKMIKIKHLKINIILLNGCHLKKLIKLKHKNKFRKKKIN